MVSCPAIMGSHRFRIPIIETPVLVKDQRDHMTSCPTLKIACIYAQADYPKR